MDVKLISTLIIIAGWGIGFRIGWAIMDRWLERRRRERESRMKNITPRKEK